MRQKEVKGPQFLVFLLLNSFAPMAMVLWVELLSIFEEGFKWVKEKGEPQPIPPPSTGNTWIHLVFTTLLFKELILAPGFWLARLIWFCVLPFVFLVFNQHKVIHNFTYHWVQLWYTYPKKMKIKICEMFMNGNRKE